MSPVGELSSSGPGLCQAQIHSESLRLQFFSMKSRWNIVDAKNRPTTTNPQLGISNKLETADINTCLYVSVASCQSKVKQKPSD